MSVNPLSRYLQAFCLLLTIAALALAGCASPGASSSSQASSQATGATPISVPAPSATSVQAGQTQAKGTIKIGAAGPFSGALSKIGLDALNAVKLAVDEANAAGGIDGYLLEVVPGDDGGDPAKGATVAEKFGTDDSVVGVIGPMTSGVTNAALPVYQKYNLVVISQSATNPSLTEQGFKVMHRLCPRDDDQGPAAAMFIAQDLKSKSVYLLDDKGTYSVGITGQVEQKLKELGVSILGHDQYDPNDKDFSTLITRIKAAKPDLVYMAAPDPSQAAMFLKQAADLGVKATFMTAEAAYEKAEFIDKAAGAAEGAYLTNVGPILSSVPEAQDFIKKFTAKYGSLSVYSGQSYEAANILIQAIRKAGVGSNGKVDRVAVLNNVHNTKDYKGILGLPIGFDAKGDMVGGPIYVLQVKNGDYVQLKTVLPRGK